MEDVSMVLEPVRVFFVELGHFLPRLFLAFVILLVGWLVAKFLRVVVTKSLRLVNFNVLAEKAGIDGFLRRGGIKTDTTGVLGGLIYWLVILVALVVAFNSLGLAYVTALLNQIVLFLPRVIVAVLILAFGAYFARFIGDAITAYCRNVGIEDADLLGRIGQYAMMVFVVLIALDQVGIGGDIIRLSFLILLTGVTLAFALAFGLGGREWAADMLQRWWPKKGGAVRKGGD